MLILAWNGKVHKMKASSVLHSKKKRKEKKLFLKVHHPITMPAAEFRLDLQVLSWWLLAVLGSVVSVHQLVKARQSWCDGSTRHGSSPFRSSFLAVYLLAMASDWLQGPYIYSLYASYGYSPTEIATLFVTGFGASLLVGTVVASLADSL